MLRSSILGGIVEVTGRVTLIELSEDGWTVEVLIVNAG